MEVQKMEQQKIRLGIIGIGNMGSEHCRNIAAGKCPEIEITAGADLRESRRVWFRENMPDSAEELPTPSFSTFSPSSNTTFSKDSQPSKALL